MDNRSRVVSVPLCSLPIGLATNWGTRVQRGCLILNEERGGSISEITLVNGRHKPFYNSLHVSGICLTVTVAAGVKILGRNESLRHIGLSVRRGRVTLINKKFVMLLTSHIDIKTINKTSKQNVETKCSPVQSTEEWPFVWRYAPYGSKGTGLIMRKLANLLR